MERSHRQLSTRLTDRLCCDNTYCFTKVHSSTTRQITAVTLHADTTSRLTRQSRTDHDSVNTELFDFLNVCLCDLLVFSYQYSARCWVNDLLKRRSTQDTVADILDDLTSFINWSDFQTIFNAAIYF
ncbi:hypothetical protein D3C72_1111930 [compost metagenome]